MTNPAKPVCTCTVIGPDYDQTTTDPACHYHGTDGTMVMKLRMSSDPARRHLRYPSIEELTSNAASEEQQIAWGRAASNVADGVGARVYEYEWRVTYTHSLTGLERETFGLDEKGARRAMDHYSQNPDITDIRLWRRPKPAKWEPADHA